jgi:Holliday junction resolvase
VKAFRDIGATVLHLHTIGKGCPDILVGLNGINYLIEIKDGSKPPSKRKLTPDEETFAKNWLGQVCIIKSISEISNIFNNGH